MHMPVFLLATLISLFTVCAAQIAFILQRINLSARKHSRSYAPVRVQNSLETDDRAHLDRG